MTKLSIAFVLSMLLLIMPTASAIEEKLSMGPYVVTFDANNERQEWNISTVESETYDGTPYVSHIASSDGIYISIDEYDIPEDYQITSTDEMRNKHERQCQTRGWSVDTYDREIDGREGYIAVVDTQDARWQEAYWLLDNNVSINVIAMFPWNEGAYRLFKTIHIEQVI